MKAIYLDCFSGLSGNMLLGAFIQAGVPVAWLEKELKKLPIADEFDLVVDEVSKNGIQAVYVDVRLMADKDVSCHAGQKKKVMPRIMLMNLTDMGIAMRCMPIVL